MSRRPQLWRALTAFRHGEYKEPFRVGDRRLSIKANPS
jgi:hypothetical protein